MTTRSTVASFFLTAALLAGGVAAQTPAGPPHFIIPPTRHSPGLDGVAMDGAGNLTFLWTRLSSTPTGFQQEAFIRRFSGADVPLGGPVRLASSRFDTVGGAVAANQRGDVLYTWSRRFTDPPSGRTDFFLRRTSPVLPTLTLLIKGDSEVAVDNAGNFVVVWPTSTIQGNRVHGQRYNRDGTKRGREFDVAPSATGSHFSPSIAMNPNTGEFVVVWEVWDDEFRPVSVRGQRFGFFSGRQGSEIEIYTQPVGEVPSVLAFFAPQVARAA
ncbi:MAG TPA: hypothetical protein VIW92_14775, partial [Thermoanaerobaculia bacterium]